VYIEELTLSSTWKEFWFHWWTCLLNLNAASLVVRLIRWIYFHLKQQELNNWQWEEALSVRAVPFARIGVRARCKERARQLIRISCTREVVWIQFVTDTSIEPPRARTDARCQIKIPSSLAQRSLAARFKVRSDCFCVLKLQPLSALVVSWEEGNLI